VTRPRHRVTPAPLSPHLLAPLLLAPLLLLTACTQPTPSDPAPGTTATPAVEGTITVLAAASLTEVFTRLGSEFEAAHPGTEVTFSFGSSATLAAQIAQGAPADVFASASPATMATVREQVGEPVDFATNTLQIAVPRGNPGRVGGVTDFADPDLRIAVCAQQVPCGAAAVQVFAAAGVTPRPDTYESDVKAALQKVLSDEVDAALVYRTDVLAAGSRVGGIDVPEAAAVPNRYPIATVRESRNPATAAAFVGYVRSVPGEQALREAGFGRP
jgi:molybdate transport system substrate-binding protein